MERDSWQQSKGMEHWKTATAGERVGISACQVAQFISGNEECRKLESPSRSRLWSGQGETKQNYIRLDNWTTLMLSPEQEARRGTTSGRVYTAHLTTSVFKKSPKC